MNKTASLENINMMVLNQKVEKFINAKGLVPTEDKCRLVKMVLRHKTHHFPVDIPFIAAVRKCEEGQVVFQIKRTKMAFVPDIDVSSETNVGKEFEISGVKYVLEDSLNGFHRFKPVFPKHQTASKQVKTE